MYTTHTVLSGKPNGALRPEFTTAIVRDDNVAPNHSFITFQVNMMDATGPEDYENDHAGNVSFYFHSREHLDKFIASLVDAHSTFNQTVNERTAAMMALDYDFDDKDTRDDYISIRGARAVDLEVLVDEV